MIKVFTNSQHYLQSLTLDVQNAQQQIFCEFYIYEMDFPGADFLQLLAERVHAGVQVHLLVDGIGSWRDLEKIKSYCREQGIRLKVFNPLPFTSKTFFIQQFFGLLKSILFWSHYNRRNHRKLVLIDDKILYLGSQNMTGVHFVKTEGVLPWQDLALRVTQMNLSALRTEVLRTWGLGLRRVFLSDLSDNVFRIPTNLVSRFRLWRQLLKKIRLAEKQILIANAYFIPHRTFLRSVIKAAKRGARVQICFPGTSDVPMIKWATPWLYPYLIKNKIEIFELDNQVLHTKLIVIDDKAHVGSHNLNYRSLLHDLELEMIIEANLVDASQRDNFWSELMKHARPIGPQNLAKVGIVQNLKVRLLLFIKYFV